MSSPEQKLVQQRHAAEQELALEELRANRQDRGYGTPSGYDNSPTGYGSTSAGYGDVSSYQKKPTPKGKGKGKGGYRLNKN